MFFPKEGKVGKVKKCKTCRSDMGDWLGEPRYNARYSNRKKRINGTSTELSFRNSTFPCYTFTSIQSVSDLLHLHIFQSTYTFSISFFSKAVPSINPKILSFIISRRGERGGGWMKISREIRRLIRSQSKNEPIGFEWQFGKSFKFLFEFSKSTR